MSTSPICTDGTSDIRGPRSVSSTGGLSQAEDRIVLQNITWQKKNQAPFKELPKRQKMLAVREHFGLLSRSDSKMKLCRALKHVLKSRSLFEAFQHSPIWCHLVCKNIKSNLSLHLEMNRAELPAYVEYHVTFLWDIGYHCGTLYVFLAWKIQVMSIWLTSNE